MFVVGRIFGQAVIAAYFLIVFCTGMSGEVLLQ